MKDIKQELIFWGNLFYKRGLLCGSSGNISFRDKDRIWLTTHGSFLGFLTEADIVALDLDGHLVEGQARPTSETPLHLGIYKRFPQVKVVLHAHSPFSVAYFNRYDTFCPTTFEERLYLGIVPAVPQLTPIVTQIGPVLEALEKNNIVVLKRHGVVAIGEAFKPTFALIELLETATKTALLTNQTALAFKRSKSDYKLFSKAHIEALLSLANQDEKLQQLEQNKSFSFAIVCNQEPITFQFKNGKLNTSHQEAEFVFEATPRIWQWVFNRQMDIFAACFQKKIKLKGELQRLIGLFPIFERLFDLWSKIGVKEE